MQGSKRNNPARVKLAIGLYLSLLILLSAASWLAYLKHRTFDSRPLFQSSDRFMDLLSFAPKTEHLRNAAETLGSGYPIYNYPAPAAFVIKALIFTFPGHAIATYFSIVFLFLLGFVIAGFYAMRNQGGAHLLPAAAMVATALFGFPLIFAVDRGNIEVVVWAFAATGLCFLLRGRSRVAAVFIGVASAIKPFSFLYFLLLLRRRKYKDAAFGAAISAAILLIALSILGHTPWQAYRQLQAGISLMMGRYIANLTPPGELRFAHSVLDFLKSLALAVKLRSLNVDLAVEVGTRLRVQPGGWDVARTLVHIYAAVALAAIALLAFVFFRKPALNQVIAAAVSVTLFPPISSEYTLLHLYIPFGAFLIFLNRNLTAGRAQIKVRWVFAYATLFGVLFAPLTFLRIYAGTCKTLVLVAILVVAASSPLPSSYYGDPTDDNSAGLIHGGFNRRGPAPDTLLPS